MISDLWVISTFQVIKESKFQTKKVNVSEQTDTTFIFLVFILTLTGRAETAPTVTPRPSFVIHVNIYTSSSLTFKQKCISYNI